MSDKIDSRGKLIGTIFKAAIGLSASIGMFSFIKLIRIIEGAHRVALLAKNFTMTKEEVIISSGNVRVK